MASCDGAALLAAAVRAAILAKAPRRTVQAVATAVAGVLVRPVKAEPASVPEDAASAPRAPAPAFGDASADALLQALRAKRCATRRAKRQRRTARRSASAAPDAEEEPLPAATGEAPHSTTGTGDAAARTEEAASAAANSRGAVPVQPDATAADSAAELASLLQQAQANAATTMSAPTQFPWQMTRRGAESRDRSRSAPREDQDADTWSVQTRDSVRQRLEAGTQFEDLPPRAHPGG